MKKPKAIDNSITQIFKLCKIYRFIKMGKEHEQDLFLHTMKDLETVLNPFHLQHSSPLLKDLPNDR